MGILNRPVARPSFAPAFLRSSRHRFDWTGLLGPALFLTALLSHPSPIRADLLVASSTNASILRFSTAGTSLGTFVPAGSGGLILPTNPIFGPDGNLYVPDFSAGAVRRYSGSTGAFIDSFVPPGSGGLSEPPAATFGPDKNLYVIDYGASVIRKYNGTTGAYVGVFTDGGGSSGITNEWRNIQAPRIWSLAPMEICTCVMSSVSLNLMERLDRKSVV